MVGSGKKGVQLAVLDLPVAVDIGRASEAGEDLMGEHAALPCVPFVTLLVRRGGDDRADVGKAGQGLLAEEPRLLGRRDIDDRSGNVARSHHRFGVARIDDQVDVARGQERQHLVVEPRTRERAVGERQRGLGRALPVPAVKEEKDRLVSSRAVG